MQIILNLDNYVLRLANIYAFDNAIERVNFWWWMVKKLPNENSLVYGDLYMVESEQVITISASVVLVFSNNNNNNQGTIITLLTRCHAIHRDIVEIGILRSLQPEAGSTYLRTLVYTEIIFICLWHILLDL